MKNVTFIGLGVMGFPMAGHLTMRHAVTVYNRTTTKAQDWATRFSGKWADTPKQAAEHAEVVCVCVGNDNDVREVVLGEHGVLRAMKAGSVLIDHTTTSAELALEIAATCTAHGVHFIDAPVSGGQAGAEQGTLTIMCGGEPEIFSSIEPILQCYAREAQLMGGHGQGQRSKMVNQICIAGVLQGLSEGLKLAQAAHLDIDQLIDVLKLGAAGSWQMENRGKTMAKDQFDFGFAIDWMRKDLMICLDEAKKYQLALPLTASVDERYAKLQAQGMGRMDTSVLIKSSD